MRTSQHTWTPTLPPTPAKLKSQLYHSIMGSLFKADKTKVIMHSTKYICQGLPSGPMLLKFIVQETCVDSNATTQQIRDSLGNLDSYMRHVKSNITMFNQHVCLLLDSLHAHGETTNNLLTNLFKGYKAATNSTFTLYIQCKE